ncbi:MAG: hypothetical protein ABEJ80_05455, partial [Halarchaeum sp.]
MGEDDPDRNGKAERLARHLERRARDGAFYFKSKEITADVGLSAKEIGQFLLRFEEGRAPADGFTIERWAYSGGTR